MRILIVYWDSGNNIKLLGVRDHLYAVETNFPDNEYVYWDGRFGVPKWVLKCEFDAIIIHNTFMCLREMCELDRLRQLSAVIKEAECVKVAIPQDEYDLPDILDQWFEYMEIDIILSIFPNYSSQLYPRMSSKASFKKVYPGYVSEKLLKFGGNKQMTKKWDVGYRASKLPYWFGSLGQMKFRLGNEVATNFIQQGLTVNSSIKPEDFLHGDDWYVFLQKSKVVLGSESGSSLVVRDQELKKAVTKYLKDNPEAEFEQVNQDIFHGADGEVWLSSVSPRHFECAALKVCQILVEGEYDGVMKANKHYIPLKRDFTNIANVVANINDPEFCSYIVENCYNDVAKNPRYSYKAYSELVIESITDLMASEETTDKRWSLKFINILTFVCSVINQFRITKIRSIAAKFAKRRFPNLYLKLKAAKEIVRR